MTRRTHEQDAAKSVMQVYILFSMGPGPSQHAPYTSSADRYLCSSGAMILHWLLVINLSVFATKLAAFVLVCSLMPWNTLTEPAMMSRGLPRSAVRSGEVSGALDEWPAALSSLFSEILGCEFD